MCVSCMFYVDWELEGQKKLKDRDFSFYRKQTFFRTMIHVQRISAIVLVNCASQSACIH